MMELGMSSKCLYIPNASAEKKFSESGFCTLGKFKCTQIEALKDYTAKNVDFGNLFLSRDEFKAQSSHVSVNTIPGRNLAEKSDTLFIFSNESFVSQVTSIVGVKWRVLDYKFVVALPENVIPSWIDQDNDRRPIKNIGAYIRPIFRNCTYFRGIDFHQDIIDFPSRNPDFVTVYIYLDNVGIRESPLFVLNRSHVIGASKFPHKLKYCEKKNLIVHTSNVNQSNQEFALSPLLGLPGDVFCWHPFLLHGTYASPAESIRISLRILVEKNSDERKDCWLDKLTDSIKVPHRLRETRADLTKQAQSAVSHNLLERIRRAYIK